MRFLRLLFHKDSSHQQLRELYRNSEDGGDVPDVDPAARETFEADRELTGQLTQLAASVQPIDASPEREALLARVREKKSLQVEKGLPVFKRLLNTRTLVAAGAAVLLLGAAATVGASGGVSEVAGSVNDVLAALRITDKGPDGEGPEIAGGQEEGLANASENANENAEHGLDNAAEGSDNAGQGIENASDQGLAHANDNALDGPNRPDTGGPALPTQVNEHAADGPNGPDSGGPQLPTQANEGAPDGSNNAGGGPPEVPGQSDEDHGSPGITTEEDEEEEEDDDDGTPEAPE